MAAMQQTTIAKAAAMACAALAVAAPASGAQPSLTEITDSAPAADEHSATTKQMAAEEKSPPHPAAKHCAQC
jgi:hypothetical protein